MHNLCPTLQLGNQLLRLRFGEVLDTDKKSVFGPSIEHNGAIATDPRVSRS